METTMNKTKKPNDAPAAATPPGEIDRERAELARDLAILIRRKLQRDRLAGADEESAGDAEARTCPDQPNARVREDN
jgi:hypothetical protein